MAVEARHTNLLHPQLLGNREMMNPIEGNTNFYNTQNMGFALPLSGTTTTADSLLPMYNSAITDSLPTKTPMKSESGVTCNIPMSRKRTRDAININPFVQTSEKNPNSFSFLGEDLACFVQQQQLDVDGLISQHMEKVRMEIEESRRKQARKIIQAIEVGMMKRLKAKQDEIDRIGKLNFALEGRVQSLCMENKIWRELAQSNEATVNTLRNNLVQVLAQTTQGRDREQQQHASDIDDAASCCGSSNVGNEGEEEVAKGVCNTSAYNNRWCKSCWKEESCVLVLPCRHLSLCTTCGTNMHVCPVCHMAKNASVHVNMS